MNIQYGIFSQTKLPPTQWQNGRPLREYTDSMQADLSGRGDSRWDTLDKVELSWAKPEVVEFKQEYQPVTRLTNIPDEATKAKRKAELSYTAEDLAPLKERFASLQKMEGGIGKKLQSLLSANRIELGFTDQLKVEIDSSGRAIVGGVKNSAAARALQAAINKDKSLLQDLKDFQKEEAGLSTDLRTVTGMSLQNCKDRVHEAQLMDPEWMLSGEGCYTRDDYAALRDQDIHLVDAEFAEMIGEYYAVYDSSPNISGFNQILEHADATVNNAVGEVIGKIAETFEEVNIRLQELIEDPEELKEQLLSLKDVTITVDNDGNVEIEGQTAIDPRADRKGKSIINNLFKDIAANNPATGQMNDFTLAANFLLNQYDEGFGGMRDERKLNTVFQDGKIESHISSPEMEQELRLEIADEARTALTDMGIDAKDLEIEVSDDGKLVVTNMPESELERKSIEQALATLNKRVESRSWKDNESMKAHPVNTMDRLKGLMSHLDVFLPGGAEKLTDIRFDNDAKAA